MIRRAARVPLALFVGVLPVLVGYLLLHHWLGVGPADYVPVHSDEVSYWHQVNSFAAVGFGHGRYSYQELPAPVGTAGAWGPVFPALIGSVLRLTGTAGSVAGYPLVLAGLFAALVATACLLTRDLRRWPLIALVTATFSPLLLFVGTGLQEPVHLGGAVLLAAVMARLLAAPSRELVIAATGLTCVLALLRPTWSFLLLAVLVAARPRGRRQLIGGLAAALGGIAAFSLLFQLWSAPFPYLPLRAALQAPTLGESASIIATNLRNNLGVLVGVRETVLEVNLVHNRALIGLLVGLLALIVARRRGDDARTGAVMVLATLVPLTFILVVYDLNTGTRVLASHVLFVVVLAALQEQRGWLILPVASACLWLVTAPLLAHDVRTWRSLDYALGDPASIPAMSEALHGRLAYRPGAPAWCNTVLLSTEHGFFPEILAIPPGIGITIDLDHTFAAERVRSGWVIASPGMRRQLPRAHLERVTTTPQGVLLRNLDAGC